MAFVSKLLGIPPPSMWREKLRGSIIQILLASVLIFMVCLLMVVVFLPSDQRMSVILPVAIAFLSVASVVLILTLPPPAQWRTKLWELAPQVLAVAGLMLLAAVVGGIIILIPGYLRIPVVLLTVLLIVMGWRTDPFDWLVLFTILSIFTFGGQVFTPEIVYEPLEYVGYLVFLFFYFHRLLTGNRRWRLTPLDLPVFFFTFFIIINAVYSLIIGNLFTNVLRESLMYPRFILIYYMVVNVLDNREKLNRFLTILLYLYIFVNLYGLYQYVFGDLEVSLKGYDIGGRIYSFFGNPNFYGGLLELTVPVVFALALDAKNITTKLFLFACTALGFINIILTFSRGALGGVLAALMIISILRTKHRVLVILLMLVIIVGLALTTNLLARQLALIMSTEETSTEYTMVHRLAQYTGYLETYVGHPVFGVGWGSYGKTTEVGIYVRSQFEEYRFGHLNGTFFDFAVHMGTIGLVVLLWLVIAVVKCFAHAGRLLKRNPDAALQWGLFAGTLAFMVHQTMDNFLKWSQVNAIFWIVIGTGVAAQLVHIDERKALPNLSGETQP